MLVHAESVMMTANINNLGKTEVNEKRRVTVMYPSLKIERG